MRRPGPYVPLSAHYADDEKIMEVGEDAELMYLRMLAYAARTPRTGGWISDAVAMSRLGVLERDGVPGSDPGTRLGKLAGVGLITREGSGWRITSWLRWNRSPEQIDRERTQDRERKTRTNTGKPTGNAPGSDTGIQSAILGAEVDTETEVEGEPKKRARRKPSHPLPEDWKPTERHVAQAAELNVDLQNQVMRFRNDALAKDKRFVDWDAAFRNWLTNAREFGQTKAAASGTPRSWWNS